MAIIQQGLILLLIISSVKPVEKDKLFPNLPLGEFKINFVTVQNCNPTPDNKINFNFNLSKKSSNTTEIKGNITLLIPIDDSLSFEAQIAVKGSNGGWNENFLFYKSPKACSMLKNFFKNMNTSGLGNPKKECPYPRGVTIAPGYDTNSYKDFVMPKVIFYGTYKIHILFTDKNNLKYGCILAIVELKRPWELP